MVACYAVEFDQPIGYSEGIELQQRAFDIVKRGKVDGILLLLQHKPAFTIGRAGGKNNLLVPEEKLNKLGIELHETTRGGNITYHGPGQLVGYPIFNLEKWNKDVHLYVNRLEEVIIQTLKEYGVTGGRKPKYIGVWVGDGKITAIGVAVKHWITMHGFAFNLEIIKDHFRLINPCGITQFGVVSLDDYVGPVDYKEIIQSVKRNFGKVFDVKVIDSNQDLLRSE